MWLLWLRLSRSIEDRALANSPVVKIGVRFRDRDSNSAKITFYCPFATPIADAMTLALAYAARAAAVSNGVVDQVELAYRYTIDDPPDPPDDSNVNRGVLLLITNDAGEINGMVIPSPGEIWETTGSYAGIRVDLAGAGALTFAAMLGAIDLRTDDNRQLGTILAAGGLAL